MGPGRLSGEGVPFCDWTATRLDVVAVAVVVLDVEGLGEGLRDKEFGGGTIDVVVLGGANGHCIKVLLPEVRSPSVKFLVAWLYWKDNEF